MATDLDELLRAIRNIIPQTTAVGEEEKPKPSPSSKSSPAPKKKATATAETLTAGKSGEGVHICIDLGNDTVKVAFAYDAPDGKTVYGKLMKRDLINQFALPATAYYNRARGKWFYADEIEGGAETEFTTVVKIKALMSLLMNSDGSVEKSNREYYFDKKLFPKFYFPVKRKMQSEFAKMEKAQMCFEAKSTPHEVCQSFFVYIKKVVDEQLKLLFKERSLGEPSVSKIAVVYPTGASTAYTDELISLIGGAFGLKPEKVMSTTRALSLLAYHKGALKSGEGALVFDMGDEMLSVVKASVRGGGGRASVIVDGADGHSEPCSLGGGDIDEAVESYLEGCIRDRETVGTPSAGEEGHIYEFGLDAKQYLLMKEIKKAKTILSKPLTERSLFKNGVPVSLYRDLHIQRKLTHEEFKEIVGVKSGGGVAKRILDYICNELSLPVNRGIKKVFIAGGLVETLGLIDYLKAGVKKRFPSVAFTSFEDNLTAGDESQIKTYEDSIYAAAVGGAIVSLKNYEIQMALSYSYGTWVTLPTDPTNAKHLMLAAERGTVIGQTGGEFLTQQAIAAKAGCDHIAGEEFYSVLVTDAEIQKRDNPALTYTQFSGKYYLKVGKEGDAVRRKVAKEVDFKVVAGGSKGKIVVCYNGRQVKLSEAVYFYEGFKVDRDGRAKPYIANAKSENKGRITVTTLSGSTMRANASDITFEFRGIDDIVMSVN